MSADPSRSLHLALERLSSLFRAQLRERATAHGLKLVQLEALVYFDSANRYSDTAGALAEYLAVTKGTASQTVRALERRGLIRKEPDADDGRVSHCALTAEGQAVVRGVDAVAAVDPARRDAALDSARELLRALQRGRGFRTFGQCASCRLFQPSGKAARCGLTGERLSKADSRLICREHEPAG